MADPRFFSNAGSITLARLAEMTGATLSDPAQGDRAMVDVAPLDKAGADQLSFFDNIKYKDQFTASRAGACFATPEAAQLAPTGMVVLISQRPYRAYALAAQAFYPDPQVAESEISQHAYIAPDAVIGEAVKIEDGAVIGAGAQIGAGCHIGPHAVIGPGVVLGDRSRVGPQASLSHCVVGQNVRIYPGARIGQDGFGFAIDPAGHVKVPQLGRVVIGDNVEIGANTCIDRGAGPDTEIGDGAWIDNLVQIGHNVKIGRGCVIVSQVGISGSTVVEDYAVLAGQAGVAGHLRIGKGARIAAQAGIMRDVEPGTEMMGYPAVPLRQFMKQVAYLNKVVSKKKQ